MLHMQNNIVTFKSAVVFVLLGSVVTELRWGEVVVTIIRLRAMNFLF